MALRSLLALALWSCSGAQPVQRVPHEPLGFLEGCWRSEDQATEEQWHRAEGGILFGFSTTRENGALVFFEELRIEHMEATATYIARPRGGEATAFVETQRSDGEVVFVNRSHDFPQRIHYRRTGGSLTATISLADGSDERSWSYQRCPGDG